MRVLSLADGLSASASPVAGSIGSSSIATAADDATYVATYGAAVLGSCYFNTSTGTIRIYDGATWQSMLTSSSVATLTNKLYDGGTANTTNLLKLPKASLASLLALARSAGQFFYGTDTKKIYIDDGALLTAIGSGGAAALVWRLLSNAPQESDSGNLEILNFSYQDSQEVWTTLSVPSDYAAGTQVKLKGGLFAINVTTNKVKFKATSYLVKAASTALGTYPNTRNSTNAEVTVSGSANQVTAIGDVDLTDASGLINGVAVAAGDAILVKLIRDSSGESVSAAADASFLRFSMIPSFS